MPSVPVASAVSRCDSPSSACASLNRHSKSFSTDWASRLAESDQTKKIVLSDHDLADHP